MRMVFRKAIVSLALGIVVAILTGFIKYSSPVGSPVPLPGGHVWSYGYPLAWYRTPMGIPGETIELPLHPLFGNLEYLSLSNLAIDMLFWSILLVILTSFASRMTRHH
jgi:hypothetical protein